MWCGVGYFIDKKFHFFFEVPFMAVKLLLFKFGLTKVLSNEQGSCQKKKKMNKGGSSNLSNPCL